MTRLEGEHSAVRVMDDVDLAGAEELLGDSQGADRLDSAATGISDDVHVTKGRLRISKSFGKHTYIVNNGIFDGEN